MSRLGWRWGLLLALAGLPVAVAMFRLPATAPEDADPDTVAVTATSQRLRRLRGFLAVTLGASVLGFAAVGLPILGTDYLQHHWHLQLGARGHVAFLAGLGAFGGLPLGGVLGDRAWSQGPGHVARLLGGALAAFGVLLAIAVFAPSLDLIEAGLALAVLALSVTIVASAQLIAAVAYPAARSLAFGIFGAYGLVFGGLGATVVLVAVGHADGIRLALGLGGAAAVASGAVVWLSAGMVADDVAVVDAEVADATRPPKHAGRRGNAALRIHDVNFSYGARQVLFGVDLEVEEGEVAGLLGTNGAGKSTLLRLVAGLDHPSSGTIRIFGRDTTYLEAEQVIGLGVSLLAGGRMSFPALTVAENLRVGGHSIRRQGARLRAAIEEVMTLFPVLAERRDQRVGTLSGGEQQMLAVARVLLTRPRLVLIDELSLGLAPKVVEGLLAIVRRVNDEGATVLLVEQSVNLALTLAPHGLFLERGEVRFDGATSELLARDDLLRPVFLGAR